MEHYAGNYGKAETVYRESLDNARARLGKRLTDVGLTVGNLAFVLYDLVAAPLRPSPTAPSPGR